MIRKRALVIGINHYEYADSLTCCENDAIAIKALLERNGNRSINFQVNDTQQMDDSIRVKNKGELRRRVEMLFDHNLGSVETALFYFSGHGYVNEIGGYLVTPEVKDPVDSFSMDDLLKIVSNSKVENKIVILDCCNAGRFGELSGFSIDATLISSGVTILASCQAKEGSLEGESHSVFTGVLIDALKGGAADIQGQITVGAIYSHIDQTLGPWFQRPVFKANVKGFNVIRSVDASVSDAVLGQLIVYFASHDSEVPLDPSFEEANADGFDPAKGEIMMNLRILVKARLAVPVGGPYLYWAAQNSGSCRLTPLGMHYWRLVKNNLI